jgi:hypothetical protein
MKLCLTVGLFVLVFFRVLVFFATSFNWGWTSGETMNG